MGFFSVRTSTSTALRSPMAPRAWMTASRMAGAEPELPEARSMVARRRCTTCGLLVGCSSFRACAARRAMRSLSLLPGLNSSALSSAGMALASPLPARISMASLRTASSSRWSTKASFTAGSTALRKACTAGSRRLLGGVVVASFDSHICRSLRIAAGRLLVALSLPTHVAGSFSFSQPVREAAPRQRAAASVRRVASLEVRIGSSGGAR